MTQIWEMKRTLVPIPDSPSLQTVEMIALILTQKDARAASAPHSEHAVLHHDHDDAADDDEGAQKEEAKERQEAEAAKDALQCLLQPQLVPRLSVFDTYLILPSNASMILNVTILIHDDH